MKLNVFLLFNLVVSLFLASCSPQNEMSEIVNGDVNNKILSKSNDYKEKKNYANEFLFDYLYAENNYLKLGITKEKAVESGVDEKAFDACVKEMNECNVFYEKYKDELEEDEVKNALEQAKKEKKEKKEKAISKAIGGPDEPDDDPFMWGAFSVAAHDTFYGPRQWVPSAARSIFFGGTTIEEETGIHDFTVSYRYGVYINGEGIIKSIITFNGGYSDWVNIGDRGGTYGNAVFQSSHAFNGSYGLSF